MVSDLSHTAGDDVARCAGMLLTYHALYVGIGDGDIACPLPLRMTDAQEALIEERGRALERDGATRGADARACLDPSVYPCG